MLKPRVLQAVLSQNNTDGIQGTLVLDMDGSVLSSAGDATRCGSVAAISASIWEAFLSEEEGTSEEKKQLQSDDLETLILDCTAGYLYVTRTSSVLLCCFSDQTIQMGILKRKMEVLKDYLAPEILKLNI